MSQEKEETTQSNQFLKGKTVDKIDSASFLKHRKIRKQSKASFKQAKKDVKVTKREYRLSRRRFKEEKKATRYIPSKELKETKKHMLKTKDAYQKQKLERKIQQKNYRRAKKQDKSRLMYQAKQDLRYKVQEEAQGDDTLGEGIELYQKGQQGRSNARMSFRVGKQATKLGVKTGKGAYGLGNRFFNFSRGRGFYRTPPDLTARANLMKKARLTRLRFKKAREIKKAERSAQLFVDVLRGKQSLKKAAQVILSNPMTWLFLVIFFVMVIVMGVVAGSPKPAIVQDDRNLTEAWVYTTKVDAEHSTSGSEFYSNIDDIMFYMNHRFDDYKVTEKYSLTKTHGDFIDSLWEDLNGTSPNYSLRTMDELLQEKESPYYMDKETYDEYNEFKETFGYTTLDHLLSFPVKTDELVISRRYGYEAKEGKQSLYDAITANVTENEDILSPLSGKVVEVPDESTIVIHDKEDSVRLRLSGVKSSRYTGGETVKEGDFLGSATGTALTIRYDLKEDKQWLSVNPAFYFPKVSYTQQTTLSTDYETANLSAEVIALIPKFKQAMKEIGMPEKFLPVVLAVCMQESGGRVPDVMQASESLGLPPNTLGTDASIKQGVKYLWDNMKLVGLDLVNKEEAYVKTAVQAYNFGSGFISFAKSNGYVYTEQLAKDFSNKMSGGTGLYGDAQYVPHVWRYIQSGGGSASTTGKFAYPLPNKLNDISGFDYRYNPITGAYELHLGLDFPVPMGTPVYASEDATVMRNSDVGDTYGINVVLKHSKGGYWTRYAHLSKANITVGSTVKRGQLVGYVGSTGASTGPHLHYEVMTSMYAGHVNPRPFIQ